MLSESTNTIGRAEDNYVLLSDPSVSRSHAQIVNVGMSFKVIDLNSQNGTFVNGKRVVSEQILQTGDEIGFGNLRFVFVPATQTVNLAMYAKSASDSKSVIVLLSSLLAVFIVILVTVAFIAYTSNKEDVVEEPQTAVAEEDTFEKLNELYTSAYHDFQANRYKAANEKLSKLLEKWPNESRVKDLQNRIDEELHNEEIIAKGDELFDQRLFKEAVETYKEISEKSMAYGRAQDRIADAEDKLLIVKYNDARDACEELSEECIDALCEAAVKLQENGKHEASLNEAKNFLDGITKNKKSAKFSAQAKKCLSDL
jgi:pSer/pThr/pTyr-binding forkhead associated (FHA) protein